MLFLDSWNPEYVIDFFISLVPAVRVATAWANILLLCKQVRRSLMQHRKLFCPSLCSGRTRMLTVLATGESISANQYTWCVKASILIFI